MKKTFFLAVILCCCLQSFGNISDSTRTLTAKEKLKNFFSLRDTDTIREFNQITTYESYKEQAHPKNNKRWGVAFGGYISQDNIFDTRQSITAREGIITMYPANIKTDKNGKDINARPSFNMLAMNTRLTGRITAPKALGADISGMLEGWFVGVANSDANGFCLRHAIIQLQWPTTHLLIGQTWHPLFTENCFAYTLTGSAGAPFQAFSRAPQIRVKQNFGINNLMLYISAQRDYASIGFNGTSSEYLRNSAIPEGGMQYFLDFKKHNKKDSSLTSNTLIGIGGDYKYLIPRVVTSDNEYCHKGVHSWAVIAFLHHQHALTHHSQLGLKVKGMYSQGVNDFLLVGGYAVRYYDSYALNSAVNFDYVGLNNVSVWFDLYANIKSWEVAIFGGYTQNLGAFKNIQDWNNANSYFTKDYDIRSIQRISARVKYTAKQLQFAFEPEYTTVLYGQQRNSLGEVQREGAKLVGNLRLLLTAILYF